VQVSEEDVTTRGTIREFKRREPFQPFRVVMTSGDRYVIEDPDALAIGGDILHYYPPHSSKAVHMRVNQIAAVEENGVN
jgi:hypothetical protein